MHIKKEKQEKVEIRMQSIDSSFLMIMKAYKSLGYHAKSPVFDKDEGCYVIEFNK